MHEPNTPARDKQELSGGPNFGIIPRWAARLKLSGCQSAVLHVIACHADKVTRKAFPSIATIAAEAGRDRRTVQRAIRQLEDKGVLEKVLRGGGWGRASEYRIIFEPSADTENSGNDAAVSDGGDTENSGVFVPETAAFLSLNSGVGAAPTDSEQKEGTAPLRGSRTRARGEDFSDDEVDRRQGNLMLPFSVGVDRRALLKSYNPSAELVDWATEQYGLNALADCVLGKFIDWRIKHNKLLVDREGIEAAYRNWIRDEARFAEQSRHRPRQQRTADQANTAGQFFEKMMRAKGAGQ